MIIKINVFDLSNRKTGSPQASLSAWPECKFSLEREAYVLASAKTGALAFLGLFLVFFLLLFHFLKDTKLQNMYLFW